jgi:hypothetical protein
VGGPALGELGVQFENDYRFSVDVPTVEGTVQGAWSGGNYVSRVDVGGDTVESYFVDGDTYVVAAGSCSAVPNSGGATGVDTGELAGTDGAERNVEQYGSITANGTTTIDGESVYVFELGGEASATYYVSAATNRLRRVVAEGVTIDYYDWGQVGSITAPC